MGICRILEAGSSPADGTEVIMNSKRVGGIAVGKAIARFTLTGYGVFIPVNDCEKYDLIVDFDSKLQRVQCKYTNSIASSGAFNVPLRSYVGYKPKAVMKKYVLNDFDLLYVYCSDNTEYLIPAESVIGHSTITVGVKNWLDYKL